MPLICDGYLTYNRFTVLFGIAVPSVVLSCKVSEENSPSLVVVVNIPS